MMRTRAIVYLVTVFVLLFSNFAAAQLPSGSNVTDAWSQGTFDGIRIFYQYRPNSDNFYCSVYYYHDGRINLMAEDAFPHIPDSPANTITTFYSLKPHAEASFRGNQLVRVTYLTLFSVNSTGPFLYFEPVISAEDTFTKRCVPLLNDLFRQIQPQEVKMFQDQYGSLFGIK